MNVYQLSQIASNQILTLDLENQVHDDIMKCGTAADVCQVWLDFLIENRDKPDFILRVDQAGNLASLIKWADQARSALSCGNPCKS